MFSVYFFICNNLKKHYPCGVVQIFDSKSTLLCPNHFIVKLRGQDTTGRTGQDDGRY